MTRVIVSVLLAGIAGVGIRVATSWSDSRAPEHPVSHVDEITTGVPSYPVSGFEIETKDPFTPYDIGPPEAVWSYASLRPEQRAVVDRGRAPGNWRAVHDMYRAAGADLHRRSQVRSARVSLGVQEIDQLGVIP